MFWMNHTPVTCHNTSFLFYLIVMYLLRSVADWSKGRLPLWNRPRPSVQWGKKTRLSPNYSEKKKRFWLWHKKHFHRAPTRAGRRTDWRSYNSHDWSCDKCRWCPSSLLNVWWLSVHPLKSLAVVSQVDGRTAAVAGQAVAALLFMSFSLSCQRWLTLSRMWTHPATGWEPAWINNRADGLHESWTKCLSFLLCRQCAT